MEVSVWATWLKWGPPISMISENGLYTGNKRNQKKVGCPDDQMVKGFYIHGKICDSVGLLRRRYLHEKMCRASAPRSVRSVYKQVIGVMIFCHPGWRYSPSLYGLTGMRQRLCFEVMPMKVFCTVPQRVSDGTSKYSAPYLM
jgi:hypothetical protein